MIVLRHRSRAAMLVAASLVIASCASRGATPAPSGSGQAPPTGAATGSGPASASASTSAAPTSGSPAPTGASPTAATTGAASATPGTTGAPAGATLVTAVDYAFQGVPRTLPKGRVLAFLNSPEATEPHEMVVVRKRPGVTQSFQELLQLPEAEAQKRITVVGATAANPGRPGPETVTLAEAGEHLIICFIPVGSEPEDETDPASAAPTAAGDAPGPPHFTRGMLQEFRVTP